MLRRSGDLLRAGVCGASGVFQDESASVSEIDFRGFPACAVGLVPEFGRVGWGFVVVGWNPGADGLPRRFDGLEGLIRPPHLAGSPCGLRLSPASKTPPLPRCFSMSKGGSGGGGRLMRASQRPRRRRKNSTSDGKGLPGQAAVGGLEQSLHQSIRTATDGWGRCISFGIT